MLKNTVFAFSLLLNGVFVYWFLVPTESSAVRMTCEEARSEVLSKQATLKFSLENNGSMAKIHDFLRASDYELRNITSLNGLVTFVYIAKSYPHACGFYLPGIDGTIVRIETDLSVIPTVINVN